MILLKEFEKTTYCPPIKQPRDGVQCVRSKNKDKGSKCYNTSISLHNKYFNNVRKENENVKR